MHIKHYWYANPEVFSLFSPQTPSPEMIVWCYSAQWQPAYMEILVSIPNIEYVKGIPPAREQDSYLDVNKRNLIVFDDQMIDANRQPFYSRFTLSESECNLYRTKSISSRKR